MSFGDRNRASPAGPDAYCLPLTMRGYRIDEVRETWTVATTGWVLPVQ